MVFSGAGLFLPAEAHKVLVRCVCVCQTEVADNIDLGSQLFGSRRWVEAKKAEV